MNKKTRSALINDLSAQTSFAQGPDYFIVMATHMADEASQGRTDRWKSACTLAGRRILASTKTLTLEVCRDYVAQGLNAMEAANK